MLSGVGVVCFAASYAVALCMEISRLVFRSGIRGAIMLGFAGAGLVAHTAFLYHRARAGGGAPLASEQDWYMAAAWVLVVVYLYLVRYHPQTPFGLFLLPLTLGLIGTGTFLARSTAFAREPASMVWGAVHGVAIILATVAVLVGFVAGMMYLHQARRLKRKRPPRRGFSLPSLEWLERLNARAIIVAMLTLGVGVLSGMILAAYREPTGPLPWYDPVVLGTMAMLGWLVIVAAVRFFYKPARAGRKVAYLTLVSFAFLVIVLAVGLLLNTQHGGRENSTSRIQNPEVQAPRGGRA